MSKIKTKKVVVFNEPEAKKNTQDLNVLIRQLKEQDRLDEIEREKRVQEIFKKVVIDGK